MTQSTRSGAVPNKPAPDYPKDATPGPWERHDTADYAEIRCSTGLIVAHVGRAADADMAAAAPDLYEALAAFIAAADAGHVSVEVDTTARAALANARGESPK